MSVGFSQLAGGWQINGRGVIYATKALAETAAKGPAVKNETYGSDADFKKAMATVVVLQPKLTPEMQARVELDVLKLALTNKPNKARKALLDTQITALLDKWPLIKRDEQALEAKAQRAKDDAAAKVQFEFVELKAKDARDAAALHERLLATDPAYAARAKSLATAKIDWGLIPLGAAVLGTGAAVIVTGGAAAGALAGGLSVSSALTVVASASTIAKAAESIAKGKPSETLAIKGLASAGADLVTGATGASDMLLAAVETGGAVGARALEIYDATKALALAGNVDAVKAVAVLATVAQERAELGVPVGVVRPLTPDGAKAVEAWAGEVKLTAVASSPPAPAGATRGQLIHTEGALAGRLNFSSNLWRPVAAETRGALRGVLVSDAGRIVFHDDWIAA